MRLDATLFVLICTALAVAHVSVLALAIIGLRRMHRVLRAFKELQLWADNTPTDPGFHHPPGWFPKQKRRPPS